MGRYNKYRILTNSSDYYQSLREERGVKYIRHYETPMFRNPNVNQRSKLATTKHIWTFGDRLYQLADQYYNSSRYWWVIAWYNGFGCEGEIYNGAVIRIPLNLQDALKVLGAS